MKFVQVQYYLVLTLLMTFMTCSVNAATGEGYGVSEVAAIADAKRNILEQEIGTMVSNMSLMDKGELIKDVVVTKANGYVKNVRVIESKQKKKGLHFVKISADIAKSAVELNIKKIQNSLERLGYPRMMISYKLKYQPGFDKPTAPTASAAYNGAEEYLTNQHFGVIDKNSSDQFVQQQKDVLGIDNNNASAKYALAFRAEYAITYEVQSSITHNSTQALVVAKIIDLSTNKVLSTKDMEVTYPARSSLRKASREAGFEIMKKIMPVVMENWQIKLNKGINFLVQIDGIAGKIDNLYDFEDIMDEVKHMKTVQKRTQDTKRVVYEVWYAGKPNKLERKVYRAAKQAKIKVKPLNVTGYRLIFKVRK